MSVTKSLTRHIAVIGAATSAAMTGSFAIASAVNEVEPNDSLAAAQLIAAGSFTADELPDVTDRNGRNVSLDLRHATIAGTGNGTFDYYKFSAIAGQAIFDVDGANFDTELAVFDASGTVLGKNDDFYPVDAGSTSGLDSFLQLKLPSAGTYYVGVARFSASATTGGWSGVSNVPSAGGTYTLHVGAVTVAGGATTWTAGGGGDWHGAGVWSAGRPILNEIADFNLNSTYSVAVNHDVSVDGVSLHRGNVTLNLNNGHTLTAYDSAVQIAQAAGESAELTLGGGGTLYVYGRLSVGSYGTGTLRITAGTHVSVPSDIAVIGGGGAGNGTATLVVDGVGSTFAVGGEVAVGNDNSTATATVSNGATVTSGYVDGGVNGHSTITVTGAGSTWTANGNWYVGGGDISSNGHADALNVQSDATVAVAGTTKIWSSAARVNLAGGTLKTGSLDLLGDASRLNWTAGTLSIQGTGSNVGATLAVPNGGTLAGVGTLTSAVSVATGGHVAPGNSPGTLHVGSTTFVTGASLDVELAGGAAGQFDVLDVTGAVTLAGATLTITPLGGYVPADGATFAIVTNDGVDAIVGRFGNASVLDATHGLLAAGGVTYRIDYAGGTGNDVVLTAILPEPATLAVFTIASAALTRRPRRREAK